MRKISEAQASLILEVSAEAESNYPPAALEKDLHLTSILQALSETTYKNIDLIFGGGTSLVKAFRLFDRMSEDLDFKFQLNDSGTKSQNRKRLTDYRNQIAELLRILGYQVINIESKNENRYLLFELRYKNAFQPLASLRPIIKLELFHNQLFTPYTEQTINSLLDQAINSANSGFKFPCVAPSQTAGEKVLSFLNRFYSDRHEKDERLIRHVHDVYFIAQMDGDIKSIADLFPNILTDEISRYSDHYSRAFTDPINFLSHNLRLFSNDKTLTRVYDKFVADLTIRSGVSVEMAKNNFIHLAEVCIQELIETNWIYPLP